MSRLLPLLLLAGCASVAPRDARMEVRYYDAAGALRERHALIVPIEERFVHEMDGVQYRFTLHEDYTVSL